MQLDYNYKSLVESLQLLACSYDDQVNALPDYVDLLDELLSIFRDSFLALRLLIENDYLSSMSIAAIIRCYNWVEVLSRNQETLTTDSLKGHKSWDKVRDMAESCLNEMGEIKRGPDLNFLDRVD